MFKYPSKKNNSVDTDNSIPEEAAPTWAPEENYAQAPEASPFDMASVVPDGSMTPLSDRNVLNADVRIVGVLRFTGELLVDGSVEGEITSEGQLTLGVNASVSSDSKNKTAISTRSAVIHGKVSGDVVCTERVELTATAELVGDITAASLAIQEGAVFIGRSTVGVSSMAGVPVAKSKKSSSTAAQDEAAPLTDDLLS